MAAASGRENGTVTAGFSKGISEWIEARLEGERVFCFVSPSNVCTQMNTHTFVKISRSGFSGNLLKELVITSKKEFRALVPVLALRYQLWCGLSLCKAFARPSSA